LSHGEYRIVSRRAHIGIQPSRTASDGDTEGGAPTVLLEMQASGIPVVSTRHADIPHVVLDPAALVDEEDVQGLADRLVELAWLSDDAYTEGAERAREFVEHEHDAGKTAKQIAAVYREALGI
jgi:colanic acid/amylovoran biosynthesis glycosyltransferase